MTYHQIESRFRFTFVLCFCFVSVASIHAQLEASNWYFGNNAGLDFSSGIPVPLLDGEMSTSEGCASISNDAGDLLFYTDGISVWNANHQTMPNGFGLTGNPSSAQSGIIAPNPANPERYYVFSVAAQGNPAGLAWSEVDITLEGGLGDVIPLTKNTQILTPSAEKIAAVQHANGSSIWVLAHELNTGVFYAWLIDCNGIQPPVTSEVGQIEGFPGWGGMAISPDGSRVGTAVRYNGFEVFDFDNDTGLLSNAIVLYNQGFGAYGASFSPNSEVFYGCNIETGEIFQWDLSLSDETAIIDSRITVGIGIGVGGFGGYQGGTLQLGPDGKLYVPQVGDDNLSAIINPDIIGEGCDFQTDHVNLAGRTVQLGLPPFIVDFLDTSSSILSEIGCAGTPSFFDADADLSGVNDWTWVFGEEGTSTEVSPSYTFPFPGEFLVQLVTSDACGVDTASILVNVPEAENLSIDYVNLCSGDSILSEWGEWYSNEGLFLDPSVVNPCEGGAGLQVEVQQTDSIWTQSSTCESFLWNGEEYTDSGQYQFLTTNSLGCDSITFLDLVITQPTSSVTSSSTCDSLEWNGSIYASSGTYETVLQNSSGCDSLTVLELTIDPTYNFYDSLFACEPMNWMGLMLSNSGFYEQQYISQSGCDSIYMVDFVLFDVEDPPTLSIESCGPYTWRGIEYYDSGTYSANAFDENGCPIQETLALTVFGEQVFIPNTFTPNNDGVNDVWEMIYEPDCWETIEYWIFNRWGNNIHHDQGPAAAVVPYWNGSVNDGQYYVSDGVYFYVFNGKRKGLAEIVEKSGHITVFR